MTKREDITMSEKSLYGSWSWVAQTLGISNEKLRRVADDLLIAGFPKSDPITGLYIKADVEAWINQRRKIPDRVMIADQVQQSGINYDGV